MDRRSTAGPTREIFSSSSPRRHWSFVIPSILLLCGLSTLAVVPPPVPADYRFPNKWDRLYGSRTLGVEALREDVGIKGRKADVGVGGGANQGADSNEGWDDRGPVEAAGVGAGSAVWASGGRADGARDAEGWTWPKPKPFDLRDADEKKMRTGQGLREAQRAGGAQGDDGDSASGGAQESIESVLEKGKPTDAELRMRNADKALSLGVRREQVARKKMDLPIVTGGDLELESNRPYGVRAKRFSKMLRASDSGLKEMMEVVARCEAGNASVGDAVLTLSNMIVHAEKGLRLAPGVRAFDCAFRVIELETQRGFGMPGSATMDVIHMMEDVACWPETSTFELAMKVYIRTAEKIGVPRRVLESFLDYSQQRVYTIIYPTRDIYRQAEAFVGPIPLPNISAPIGVYRGAVEVSTATLDHAMRVVIANMRHFKSGLDDVHSMLNNYGRYRAKPERSSLIVCAEVVRAACEQELGSVSDIDLLFAKMDFGRFCVDTNAIYTDADPGFGLNFLKKDRWKSQLRPGAEELWHLLMGLAAEVQFNPQRGMTDASELMHHFETYCDTTGNLTLFEALANVAFQVDKRDLESSQELEMLMEQMQETEMPIPQRISAMKESLDSEMFKAKLFREAQIYQGSLMSSPPQGSSSDNQADPQASCGSRIRALMREEHQDPRNGLRPQGDYLRLRQLRPD